MVKIEVEQDKISHLKSILRTFKAVLEDRLSKSDDLREFDKLILEDRRKGVKNWLEVLEGV